MFIKRLPILPFITVTLISLVSCIDKKTDPLPPLDNSPPTVNSVVPISDSLDELLLLDVSITFDKSVILPTNKSDFVIQANRNGALGIPLIPTELIRYGSKENTLIFKTPLLEINTRYQVLVRNIKDTTIDQNVLVNEYIWFFSTVTPPEVQPVTLKPSKNQQNVDPAIQQIELAFNEAMFPPSISTVNFKVNNDQVAIRSVVLQADQKTVIIDLASTLLKGQCYTVTVYGDPNKRGRGVKDNSSQHVPLVVDYNWSFCIAGPNTAKPTVSIMAPLNDGSLVDPTSSIIFEFNEPMDPVSVKNDFRLVAGNLPVNPSSVLLSDSLTTTFHYNATLNSATFKPTSPFTKNQSYTAFLVGQSADLGNPVLRLNSANSITFTVKASLWNSAQLNPNSAVSNSDVANAFKNHDIVRSANYQHIALIWSDNGSIASNGIKSKIFDSVTLSWRDTERVNLVATPITTLTINPKMMIANNGTMFTSWQQFDGVTQTLWANKYQPLLGWGIAQQLGIVLGDQHSNLYVANNSEAIIVWQSQNTNATGIYSSIYSSRYSINATRWSDAELRSGTLSSVKPAVSLTSSEAGSTSGILIWFQNTDGQLSGVFKSKILINIDRSGVTTFGAIDSRYYSSNLDLYNEKSTHRCISDGLIETPTTLTTHYCIISDRSSLGEAFITDQWGYPGSGRSRVLTGVYRNVNFDSNHTGIVIYNKPTQQAVVDLIYNYAFHFKSRSITATSYSAGFELFKILGDGPNYRVNTGPADMSIDANFNSIYVYRYAGELYYKTFVYDGKSVSSSLHKPVTGAAIGNKVWRPKVTYDNNGNAISVWQQDVSSTTMPSYQLFYSIYQ